MIYTLRRCFFLFLDDYVTTLFASPRSSPARGLISNFPHFPLTQYGGGPTIDWYVCFVDMRRTCNRFVSRISFFIFLFFFYDFGTAGGRRKRVRLAPNLFGTTWKEVFFNTCLLDFRNADSR